MNDLDFKQYERCAVKRKCVLFGKDGNSVIKPYKVIYNFGRMTQDEGLAHLFLEVIHNDDWYEDTFYLYEDLGEFCYNMTNLNAQWTVQQIVDAAYRHKYKGKQGVLKRLADTENNKGYINLLDIELCRLLGENTLAQHYIEYRAKKIALQEKDRQRRHAERVEKQKQYEIELENRHKEQKVRALQMLRQKGELRNAHMHGTDTMLIPYLFKELGVEVPIKTKGWMNKALLSVGYHGGVLSYSYDNRHNDSKVFMKYLHEFDRKLNGVESLSNK